MACCDVSVRYSSQVCLSPKENLTGCVGFGTVSKEPSAAVKNSTYVLISGY